MREGGRKRERMKKEGLTEGGRGGSGCSKCERVRVRFI